MNVGNELWVRVAEKSQAATNIVIFDLVGEKGEELPPFTAGAHIDIHLPGGVIRQYSLVNAPKERHHYVIAVLRDANGRGGSLVMHDTVQVGDVIKISPPKNCFELATTSRHKILIAGGIGITPFLSMMDVLYANGQSFELHYSAKNREGAAFIDNLSISEFSEKIEIYLTDESDQRLNTLETLANAPANSEVYVCGPPRLVDATVAAAKELDWSDDRIKWEAFSGLIINSSANSAFQVKIASSGKSYSVPKDKTIAEILNENRIPVELSCAQGVCGTCLTRVIAGVPDHRDIYLTPAEQLKNDQILICCSRSLSPELVLDL